MKQLLFNGKIRTDKDTYVSEVLIEDGIIQATGEKLLSNIRNEAVKKIDLGGRLALPGFNDSHMHFLNVGYNCRQINLDQTHSISEVVALCKEKLADKQLQQGQWIRCFRWNEYNWEEKRYINRYDLDQISTEYPILAIRACVHFASLNTKAMEILGLFDKNTVYTGELECDENGVPTGVTKEMLPFISEHLPEPSVEEIKRMLLDAGEMMAADGITSVQSDDFASVPGNNYQNIIQAFRELSESGTLPVRVYEQCCLPGMQKYQTFRKDGFHTGMGNDIFRLGPIKLFCDGALGGRTAWLKEPYSDDPENTGISLYPDGRELDELVLQAHRDGMSAAIHCIGDAAAEQAITAIEKAQAAYPNIKTRHGIVHAQILDAKLIQRMQAAHIIAYIQPAFLEYDLHIAEDRIGAKRLENSYHYRKMYDSGICIPFGTDSPVEDFSPMKNIYCAVTGKDYTGYPPGGWHPEKLLTLDEALYCYTEYSAYASFEEHCKGKIAPGYFADIVVMDEDITLMPKDQLQHATVYLTMMNGNITYQKAQ